MSIYLSIYLTILSVCIYIYICVSLYIYTYIHIYIYILLWLLPGAGRGTSTKTLPLLSCRLSSVSARATASSLLRPSRMKSSMAAGNDSQSQLCTGITRGGRARPRQQTKLKHVMATDQDTLPHIHTIAY